ncbi:hypothetical protein VTN96DRAFT_10038 [Rasamsonia emersonii]
MKQRLKTEVWDPFAKIAHYYTFPVKSYYTKDPNEPESPDRFLQDIIVAPSHNHVEPAPKATPAHTVQGICKETPNESGNPWYVHNPYADPEPPKEQPKQKLRLKMPRALNGSNNNNNNNNTTTTTTTTTTTNGTTNNNNDEMDWESTASSDGELTNDKVLKGLQRARKRGFSSVDDSNPSQPSQISQISQASIATNQIIADKPIKRMRMSKLKSPIDIGRASTTDEDSSDGSDGSDSL